MRRLAAAFLLCLSPLPLRAEAPLVVTDIPPVHALVAQVMGDLGTPVLLLDPGADEHDFALRPSQMRDIAGAGLIVWIGPALTPWLDRARAPDTPALTLLPDPGADPHLWLDPVKAAAWLPLIAAALSDADPANAGSYAANANAAAARIAALDADLRARLAPLALAPFVTQHDAYGHFTAHYRLAHAGAIMGNDAAAPGAGHLADLRAALEQGSVQCLFPEAQHDTALALQLLEGTPARLGPPLDPVGSTLPPGPGAYEALLRGLGAALAACLTP